MTTIEQVTEEVITMALRSAIKKFHAPARGVWEDDPALLLRRTAQEACRLLGPEWVEEALGLGLDEAATEEARAEALLRAASKAADAAGEKVSAASMASDAASDASASDAAFDAARAAEAPLRAAEADAAVEFCRAKKRADAYRLAVDEAWWGRRR